MHYFLLLLLSYSFLLAREAAPSIKVIGNKRIQSSTIVSFWPSKEKGENKEEVPYENSPSNKIDHFLKSLYATGYFKDVKIRKEGNVLIVEVVENPIINRIALEGNEKLKDEELLQELKLRPREVLFLPRIQEAQQHLLEIYKRMGRHGARVEAKIIKLAENRADLVFEISEGEPSKICNISFIGNKAFAPQKLEQTLISKRRKWYRFFSDDSFDKERLAGDKQALIKFYNDNGYPDFQVRSALAEMTPDQENVYLIFNVQEGDKYSIGNIKVESNLSYIKTETLKDVITIQKGDTFSEQDIEKTVEALTTFLEKQGIFFVAIEPQFKKDPLKKVCHITFKLQEAPKQYVGRILITGNDHTRDEVIRRVLDIHEGDPLNTSRIKSSEGNIRDLGYFKNVIIEPAPGVGPDQKDLLIKVEEQATGEFMISGGYSTFDGPLVNVKFVNNNFRGTGQIFHSDLTIAKKRQDFDVGLVEPFLFNRPLQGSVDFFHTRSTRYESFTYRSLGGNTGLSYKLSQYWMQSWGYGLKAENIGHISPNASSIIKKQQGNANVSIVSHGLSYDRRDSRLTPTKGFIANLTTGFAGLGGNIRYLKNDLGASFHYPFAEEVNFNLRGHAGRMDTVRNGRIRVVDTFVLGLDSFRGFQFNGIGPRDLGSQDKDPLGGMRYWTATAETLFPIGLPNEFGVKGALFSDFGTLWKPAQSNKTTVDDKKLRISVGFGIAWQSPFGPLRLDYAIPVKKKSYDQTQRILIGYSTRF